MKSKIAFPLLLQETTARLLPFFSDANLCRQYALWLIEDISGANELTLLAQKELPWDDSCRQKLEDYLEKLTKYNMPLAYVLGSTPFGELDIICKPPILIPRPETEEWCMELIEQLRSLPDQKLVILDLCTGTGCVALALANALPHAQVYGIDINEEALALASLNAAHNTITNVVFLHSDLFQKIPPSLKFDLIVGNPPYIPQKDWPTLDKSVAQWEDKNALIAEDDGLALIKKIITDAPHFTKTNSSIIGYQIPQLMLEIDHTQGAAVANYMLSHGYSHVKIHQDLEGKDRVASGSINNVAIPQGSP